MFNDLCKKLEIPPFTGKILCSTLLVIVVIIVAVFLHNKYVSREGFLSNGKRNFVYCHMNGCPHCDSATPEWDKFVKGYSKNEHVKFAKIESREDPEFMKKHNVVGFPTFMVIDKHGNKEREYHGKRTFGGFVNFFKTLIHNLN